MQVRIQNDGKHFYATRFTSVETGEELRHVTKAVIVYEASEKVPTATLTMFRPSVDIIVDAEIKQVCPCCGHSIEPDGKVTSFIEE